MRTAFSAGQNDGGQLGMPDAIQHRTPNPILGIKEDVLQVAAGGMHSVVLTNTGLYTFGVGDEYATGRSDNDRNPVLVFPNFKGKDISKIAAGDNLTAFIYKDNLYVFGTFRGENGVIGVNNDVLIQQKPEQIFLGVNESESAKDIAVGDNHVVVLCHSGNVYAFGRSDNYQTGYRTSTRHNNRWCSTDYPIIKNIQLIGAGAHHCIFVTTTFDIYTCGINGFGQLGIPTRNLMQQLVKNSELTLFFKQLNDPLIQVDGSNDNSFFLTKDGKVFAIGKCTFGLVGTKVKNSDHTIEPQLLDFKYPIKSIAAGGSAALALTQDQIVYSWVLVYLFRVKSQIMLLHMV